MKIVSWNVNGLRSIHNKGFLDFLTQHSPDLLCLQETKAHFEQLTPEQRQPDGYTLELHAAKRRGYSGVALYRKEGFVAPSSINFGLGEQRFDVEGRYLITEYPNFTLYNIYFPSGSSGEQRQMFKYEFLDHLYQHFQEMPQSQRAKCVVCGDFNICHTEIDIHHPKKAAKLGLSGFLPEERAWMDRFAQLGFTDTFREQHGERAQRYSWWSYRANARQKNLGWRLDYIFVGTALVEHLTHADIHENIMGSDHCPVSVELSL